MPAPITIKTVAALSVKAAATAGKAPRVSIVAYGGGIIEPPGFGPTVIDLAGLNVPPEITLLADHENALGAVVGRGKPSKQAGALTVVGTLTAATEAGRMIVALARDQVRLQASVGVETGRRELLRPGQTVQVNGTTFTAPDRGLLIVRTGTLREISITAVGADATTSVDIAAKSKGNAMAKATLETTADDEQTIRASERERIAEIETLCRPPVGGWGNHASRVETLRARAVAGEITADGVRAELLDVLRASRPSGPAIHTGANVGSGEANALEAAVCLSAGLPEKFVGQHYDQPAMNVATSRGVRGIGIHGLIRATLRAAGRHVPDAINDETIRAAFEADRFLRAAGGFSTVSLPGILGNVANKTLLAAYQSVVTTWPLFCSVASNGDFKKAERYRMVGIGQFQKVGPAGELKHVHPDEQTYESKLDTFGAMLALNRQQIINDDLSAFLQVPKMLGRMGAIALEKAVYTLLMSNPSNFFHANNKNLVTGAGSVLSIAALTAVETLFIQQTDNNGDPVLIQPKVLLVPPPLSSTATPLVSAQAPVVIGSTTADKPVPAGNPFAGRFTPATSPWLTTAAITGNSATAWYLFGGPGDVAAIEVSFLNGQATPTIESGETDFNTLGMEWRAYHDFAVAMQDFRAAVKSNGA